MLQLKDKTQVFQFQINIFHFLLGMHRNFGRQKLTDENGIFSFGQKICRQVIFGFGFRTKLFISILSTHRSILKKKWLVQKY